MSVGKEYKMLFQLQAQMESSYKGTFTMAKQQITAMQQEIQALNSIQSDIAAYQRQQGAIEATRQKLAILQQQYDNIQQEIRETESYSSSLENRLLSKQQQIDKATASLGREEQELQQMNAALKEAGIDTNDLAGESKRLSAQIGDLKEQEEAAAEGAEDFGEESVSAFTAVSEALAAAGIAKALKEIYDAYMECVNIAGDFEASMSNVEALSGASAQEMALLNEKAKELGATTKFTAQEASDAMGFMAMAGWDAQEMLSGMDGVLQLAAASGEDLAMVSDIVTDNLTAFGLKASDTARFSDVLAAAATNSNTSVSIMGETFKNAASIAGALGYSVEDVATAVGLMANAGIKGSVAGTALKNTFNGLLEGVTLTSNAFGEYKYTAINADGTMKSFSSTIKELRTYFNQMSEAERVSNAQAIAGNRAYNGLLAILNATDADYKSLASSIDNCTGAAKRMAEIKLDNMVGQLTIMQSAWDGLKISIGEQFTPIMGELYEVLGELLGVLKEFVDENPELVQAIGVTVAVFGLLTTAVTAVAAAMALASAAGITLQAALPALGIITAISVGVGALVGVISALANNSETAAERIDRLKDNLSGLQQEEALIEQYNTLAEAMDDASLSEEELAANQEALDGTIQALKEAYPELLGDLEAGTKAWDLQTKAILANIKAQELADSDSMVQNSKEAAREYVAMQQEFQKASKYADEALTQWESATDFDAEGAIEQVNRLRDALADDLEMGNIEFGSDAYEEALSEIESVLSTLTGETIHVDGLADVDYWLGEISAGTYDAANGVSHWSQEYADATQNAADAQKEIDGMAESFRFMLDNGYMSFAELQEATEGYDLTLSELGITSEHVGEQVSSGAMTAEQAMTRYGMSEEGVRRAVLAYEQTQLAANEATEESAEVTQDSYKKQLQLKFAAKMVTDGLLKAEGAAAVYGLTTDELNAYLDAEETKQNNLAAALAYIKNGFMDAETAASTFGLSLGDIQVERVSTAVEELCTAYQEAYSAAYESLSGQFNLWDKAEQVSATSLSTLQSNLDSQIKYWQNYNSNLQILQNSGIDLSGVWASLTDGSEEAVAAVAGMAQSVSSGDTTALQTYVDSYNELQETLGTTSDTIATSSEEVTTAMTNFWNAVGEGFENSAVRDMALQSGTDTINGFLEGLDGSVVSEQLRTEGDNWIKALNSALGVHSPSTKTRQSGENTIDGFVNGVNDKAPEGAAAMENAALLAIQAFQAHMTYGTFYAYGRNAMQGAVNGIRAMQPSLVAAARAAGTAAANAYKDAQDINSPSKLFQWFSEMDMLGAIRGIEQSQDKVNAAFYGAAQENMQAYRDAQEYVAFSPDLLNYLSAKTGQNAYAAMDAISAQSGYPKIEIHVAPVYNLSGAVNAEEVRWVLAEHDEELRQLIQEAVEEMEYEQVRRGY